ncbi:MAG: OmpA family protein [Patescibacteria group bacterium]
MNRFFFVFLLAACSPPAVRLMEFDGDQCPNELEDLDGFWDEDGCPDYDNDQDGLLDQEDKCPNTREDADGFEDEDGCPEPDNDDDGWLDREDLCPSDPETHNGFEDEDGCPDATGTEILGNMDILDRVLFDHNSATISPDGEVVVLAVARTIWHYPELDLVEVKGHADDTGDISSNYNLSDRRAYSVVLRLLRYGIKRDRLVQRGYGSEQRFDPNDGSVSSRQASRRVEFRILRRVVPPRSLPIPDRPLP